MITEEMLTIERNALINDSALYFECLNGKRLTERKTEVEIRDGCILFWHVYMHIAHPNCDKCGGTGNTVRNKKCPVCKGKKFKNLNIDTGAKML